jgi:hypothetical protein
MDSGLLILVGIVVAGIVGIFVVQKRANNKMLNSQETSTRQNISELLGQESSLTAKIALKERDLKEIGSLYASKEHLLEVKISERRQELSKLDEIFSDKERLLVSRLAEKEKDNETALRSQRDSLEYQKNLVLSEVQRKINSARSELESLEKDSRYELAEVGFYTPLYDFDNSIDYKIRLVDIRSQESTLLSNKEACVCDKSWTINGNRTEGKKVTSAIVKLMLRAFIGESDALIAKVKFSNVDAYQKQLFKIFEAINKLGGGFSCRISDNFLSMKEQELRLVYEYNEKLYEEKEEQRALKEKMRDERKAQEELERAEREAKDEEERAQLALDRAKALLKNAHDDQKKQLLANIAELERKLKEAEEKGKHAISMAQQTKRGHVYIVSNIGSFGEDVFKIGMTRRLEPQDRVDELGGASVPFRFDVHAMIKTDDAPMLEHALHCAFHNHRVNKENRHKEFFKVGLHDIAAVVKEHHGEFELTKLAEAREYRKGLMTNKVSIPLPAPRREKQEKEISMLASAAIARQNDVIEITERDLI